jgi:hypothetical protein
MVAVQIDARQLAKLQRVLGHIKDGVPRALAPAINRALSSGKTVVKREIRAHYLIKAKDIPIAIDRANRATLSGQIVIRQGMLDLSLFPHSGGFKGRMLVAHVKKGGRGPILTGFQAGMATGHIGLYQRRGDARLPIKKLVTVGAPIMASQSSVGPAVNLKMGETLAKRIDHEMQRVLNSAG